jgi:hypothetical protein
MIENRLNQENEFFIKVLILLPLGLRRPGLSYDFPQYAPDCICICLVGLR